MTLGGVRNVCGGWSEGLFVGGVREVGGGNGIFTWVIWFGRESMYERFRRRPLPVSFRFGGSGWGGR